MRHRVLVLICSLVAVNQLGFGTIVPVIALYARSFDVSQSAIGLAIAVYGLARFLVAVPGGQLADSSGRRAALAAGGITTAVGNLLCAYAPTFATFVAARFVAGAGATLVLTTGLIVVADISTPAQRGRAMATYQGVFLFAVGVGPFPGGLLAAHFGLRAPFLVYSVAGVLGALIAWFIIPETRRILDPATTERAETLPFRAQIRLFMSRTGFVLVSLVSFTNAVARTGGLFNVIPVLARDRLNLSTDRLGFGLALASLTGLVLTYPAGVLVDRYGRKAVIVPSTVISGIALLMFLRAPSYAWFLAACVVWSIAMGVSGAAPAAYAADVAPQGMNAAAMSTFRMLSDLGYVVGPIVLGLAADALGANATLAATAALLVIVGAVFLRWTPETYRARF